MNDLGGGWLSALRGSRRAPQYAALVVLTLALGIGGNAASPGIQMCWARSCGLAAFPWRGLAGRLENRPQPSSVRSGREAPGSDGQLPIGAHDLSGTHWTRTSPPH
jgi:hypothetical protein